MSWKVSNPVDAREAFVSDYIQKTFKNFSQLCGYHGISRQSGYKWLSRYLEQGKAGLIDQPRVAHQHPRKIDESLIDKALQLRRKYPSWGPLTLYYYLIRNEPDIAWPKASTIGKYLDRRGLIERKKRRKGERPQTYQTPRGEYYGPNAAWSTDFKGQMSMGLGAYCLPLTLQDICSRYLIEVKAVSSTGFKDVWPSFHRIFCEYGLPDVIRSDNGPPFASRSLGGLSLLSIRWIKLGITPHFIEPGHPEQNGTHERMHRTLEDHVGPNMRSTTPKTMQGVLDEFRRMYNEERPHHALGGKTPKDVYVRSPNIYPRKLKDPRYHSHMLVERVNKRGDFYFMGQSFHLSPLLANELIGMTCEDTDTKLFFGPIGLGVIFPNHFKADKIRLGKRRFIPYKH